MILLLKILYIIMILDFISYVSYIWYKFGIQKSISESYYVLPKKKNYLFTLFTWIFAIPVMFIGNSLLMFFAGGGIVWVGANAAMHEEPTRAIHLIAAIGGMILGGIAMIFQYDMWYMTAGVAASLPIIYLIDKKHFMWWAELVIFTAISIVIGISIF